MALTQLSLTLLNESFCIQDKTMGNETNNRENKSEF